VAGRRFYNTQLVTVWIRQDLPPEAEFSHRLLGEEDTARRPDTLHFSAEITGAKVKMQPVLGRFLVLCALEQQLQASTSRGEQAQVLPDGRPVRLAAKQVTPERG
jgi:hypothetical protein